MEPFSLLTDPTLEAARADMRDFLLALGLGSMRVLGMVAIVFVFTRPEVGRFIRVAFALAVALPLVPVMRAELRAMPERPEGLILTAILAKEFAVGLALGVVLSVPFWAIQLVGEFTDMQRGVTQSDTMDASTQSPASPLNVLVTLFAIATFVSAGGLRLMVEFVYQSLALWPMAAFVPAVEAPGIERFASALHVVFLYGLTLSGPFVVLFFLSDLVVALVARAAPQISSFALAPVVKNIVFILFAIAYALFLLDYVRAVIGTLADGGLLEGLVRPQAP